MNISAQIQRRFILGRQGLYPGRRWQGKAGVAEAIRQGVVVQIDPLSMVARSHDIALHSRVIDYFPNLLNSLLYHDRAFFDYGGNVRVYPMDALPYWRVVMARKGEQRAYLAEQNPDAVVEVLAALRERAPLSNRDFESAPGQKKYWHAAKSTAQALYYLWLKGEVMTHSRRGFERRYDLADRVAPAEYQWQASEEEAESYFALRILQEMGMIDLRGWRGAFASEIQRKVTPQEAADRLEAMIESGTAARVRLDSAQNGKVKDPVRYLPASDLPQLEDLQAGRIPDTWQPLGPTTQEEASFLAPLDIVSARGRAMALFGFDYKWEVYTPVDKRRWGYYVLPVLYGDCLVARFDSRFDRPTRTLAILGFWLEEGTTLDERLEQALAAGFRSFAGFLGAGRVAWGSRVDEEITRRLEPLTAL